MWFMSPSTHSGRATAPPFAQEGHTVWEQLLGQYGKWYSVQCTSSVRQTPFPISRAHFQSISLPGIARPSRLPSSPLSSVRVYSLRMLTASKSRCDFASEALFLHSIHDTRNAHAHSVPHPTQSTSSCMSASWNLYFAMSHRLLFLNEVWTYGKWRHQIVLHLML